jgi:hypothetical protein
MVGCEGLEVISQMEAQKQRESNEEAMETRGGDRKFRKKIIVLKAQICFSTR